MAETQVANVQDGGKSWRKHNLYLSDLEGLKSWDVIDVLKLTGGMPKNIKPQKPGISNITKDVKDRLAADPYNMFLINELSIIYAADGNFDKSAAVLVRGWKRAGEIEDKDIRFRFLMKLCELSFKLGKFYQADAVIRDVEEPEDPKDLRAYLVVACRVYANKPEKGRTGGDLLAALKCFQRAIEGVDSAVAVRILALTQMDLKKVGGYEAAKSAVEKVVTTGQDKADMEMLDHFATRVESAPKEVNMERNILISGAVAIAAILVFFLYTLEKWSLAKLK